MTLFCVTATQCAPEKFARWWLPDDVVFIDETPKTSVGKFDKKVLRDRYQDYVVGGPKTMANTFVLVLSSKDLILQTSIPQRG